METRFPHLTTLLIGQTATLADRLAEKNRAEVDAQGWIV